MSQQHKIVRPLLHGFACIIMLILLYKIGQLRQIRADNEHVATLIQDGLVESLPIHQAFSTVTKYDLEWELGFHTQPRAFETLTQLQYQKSKMDSLTHVAGQFVHEPEKLSRAMDSILQVHYKFTELIERNSVTHCGLDPFGSLLSSDQLQWQAGQPVTLQLLLTSNDPHKYFQEVPISVNHYLVKNYFYQQQFNTSGTHPLHIRYQHPKTLDSMTLTYFVNVQ